MGDKREYRVVWRREHDKRKRTRLYQSADGALDFARFISRETWETINNMEDYMVDHLRKLGNPMDVTVESRIVDAWEEGWPEHD